MTRRRTEKLSVSSAAFACALAFVVSGIMSAQQRDVVKPPVPPPAAAAAAITGIVRTADAASQPLRRAVVTITGGDLGTRPRSAITGDDGRFAFGGLTAGRYTLTARKAAYLQAEYGAIRPRGAGTPVALAAGQTLDLAIGMFRGASVSGTVRDRNGQPIAGIDVRVMDIRTLAAPPDGSPIEIATSDDRGVYRIFNLPPGEYLVVALPPPGSSNSGAPTVQEVDAALAMLSARASVATPAAPSTPPPPPRIVGFAPAFYPGTPYSTQATRVRVGPGEERAGLDIELQMLPFASVEGRVTGNLATFDSVQVTLIPGGPRVSSSYSTQGMSGRPPDAEGLFAYGGIAPGPYRLVARAQRGGAPSPGGAGTTVTGRGGGAGGGNAPFPGTASGGEALYGVADIDVRGEDLKGVTLALGPGGTIHGRIAIRGAGSQPVPTDLSGISLGLGIEGGGWTMSSDGITMGPGMLGRPVVRVQPNGDFTIESIAPGRFLLSGTVPGNQGKWQWRSAMAGGRDLLDGAVELGPGIDLRDVVVTLSDIPTELTGTLQSASGQPTAGYFIVALPANRELLTPRSRRILWTRPDTSGRFTFAWPPAGDYVIAALTDLDPIDLQDLAFLEQVASAGIKVTVPEGQKTTQDLRIR